MGVLGLQPARIGISGVKHKLSAIEWLWRGPGCSLETPQMGFA